MPPLPPFQGPVPVPIPHVVPDETCMHWKLPGTRWSLVIPQAGVWSYEWQDSLGTWYTGIPFWYEPGQGFRVETAFPFRITWAPSSAQGTQWHVVSDIMVPHPAQLCLDF